MNEPLELSLDETVTWRTIVALSFPAAAISIVTYIGVVVLVGVATRSALLAFTLGFTIATTTFWLLFLLSARQEPVGEWRVLLDDRAPAAAAVYSLVCGRLRDRRLPIHAVVSRTRTEFGVSNHLILSDGHYKICVSVFEYGTSLYLGWTMWRTRRGATLLGRFLSDLANAITGLDPVPRTERPQAMREAAHAICREGMHAATDRTEIPTHYGFPHGLPPIEDPPGFGPTPTTGAGGPGRCRSGRGRGR